MIDPAAGWFEISPKNNDVKSITEEKIVEHKWFSVYP